MKKIVALVFAFIAFGCQNDSNPTTVDAAPITSYYFANMHYTQPAMPSPTESNKVTLEYNSEGQIIKRLGGVRAADPTTGFSAIYASEVSDDISYSDHSILVEEGRILPYYQNPASRTKYLLDSNNRVTEQINIKESLASQNWLDTIKYTYNSSGLLSKTVVGKPNNSGYEYSQYYYNSEKNLDSIITIQAINSDLFNKIKQTFDSYDNARNPIKNLFLFKEIFLRTLSKNNYMHYEKKKYNYDNNLVDHEIRNWTIPHDANGEILFDAN
jgi:hypothetical protein